MSDDQLYSFLMIRTTYFSYSGIPKNLQEIILKLCSSIDGVIYPRENFEGKDGSDLGLGA